MNHSFLVEVICFENPFWRSNSARPSPHSATIKQIVRFLDLNFFPQGWKRKNKSRKNFRHHCTLLSLTLFLNGLLNFYCFADNSLSFSEGVLLRSTFFKAQSELNEESLISTSRDLKTISVRDLRGSLLFKARKSKFQTAYSKKGIRFNLQNVSGTPIGVIEENLAQLGIVGDSVERLHQSFLYKDTNQEVLGIAQILQGPLTQLNVRDGEQTNFLSQSSQKGSVDNNEISWEMKYYSSNELTRQMDLILISYLSFQKARNRQKERWLGMSRDIALPSLVLSGGLYFLYHFLNADQDSDFNQSRKSQFDLDQKAKVELENLRNDLNQETAFSKKEALANQIEITKLSSKATVLAGQKAQFQAPKSLTLPVPVQEEESSFIDWRDDIGSISTETNQEEEEELP